VNSPTFTLSSGTFEAARRLDEGAPDHRCRSVHGHSFRATVIAQLHDGWAPFPGCEVPALREKLEQRLSSLDYVDLNTLIDQPSDENLARWIRRSLSVPEMERVAVQSASRQGLRLDGEGRARVWRRYRFEAAHYLPHVPTGHKCGRMHGHGFEVILHAQQAIGSPAHSIHYDDLDAAWSPVKRELDHQCLNQVVGLDNPTSELISSWIWHKVKPALPQLCGVSVFETSSCGSSFDGNSYRIWKDFTFDSAVQLRHASASGALGRLHGHTFLLRLHLRAPLDSIMGWAIDFGDVKTIFDPVFQRVDHRSLNEMNELQDADTGSIARWIHRETRLQLPQLSRVDLFEVEGCGAIVAAGLDDRSDLPV
jgi:6-pyruvoyltetrahydropterin/6-carboxytetrahydropterin synthase